MSIDWSRIVTAEAQAATSLAAAQAAAGAGLQRALDAAAAAATGAVPLAEKLSWPGKEAAARAVAAGTATAADAALLAAEAAITGEATGDLAQRILARAEALRVLAARLAGLRRRTEAAIAAADSPLAVAQALEGAEVEIAAAAAG